jgi:DNA polymerase-4
MKVIFHVDMDAFYAAVEQNDHPEHRGKPVVIGALPGRRGVVSACSYEARRYGIHSAMPISEAYRRCPHAVYLPVRMERYQEVSAGIMEMFYDYTPEVHQISVDEAFLDMTGTERLFGPPDETAVKIKKRVREETGCTLSIGIAENHFLAKLASEADKPDGLFHVMAGREIEFLDTLQLKDLWGVGKKTLARMEELNITSIQKLRQFSKGSLETMFGKAAGTYLYEAVRGRNPGVFIMEPKNRSVSNEVTFGADTRDNDSIKRVLLELAHQVMFRLLKMNCVSKTVCLKVRFDDFTTTSVQKTLRHYLGSADEIYAVVLELLRQRWNGSRLIRLIGVGVSSVEEAGSAVQGELFEDEYDRRKKVEKAVLELGKKMPGKPVVKANLLKGNPRKNQNSSS